MNKETSKALRAAAAALLLPLAVLAPGSAGAETFALLVGINDYTSMQGGEASARRWRDLRGAVNDARAMQSVLQARYAIPPQNIRLLTAEAGGGCGADGCPTREGILDALESHLLANAGAGRQLVFYYSGHGSQVSNPESTEQDRLDESIVPMDAIAGARDIRDKELRARFNRMLDRGARLVVIADSCHSGSISRGLPLATDTSRALEPREQPFEPVADAGPVPASRGAIVLSASSPAQLALEKTMPDDTRRGGFTYALIKTLLSDAAGEPLERTFRRTEVHMKGLGLLQDPQLDTNEARRGEPLIAGGPAGPADSAPRLTAGVIAVGDGSAVLQGGRDLGLYPGTVLRIDKPAGAVDLEITDNAGLTRSNARILPGSVSVAESGDLAYVTRWAYFEPLRLRVWLGESAGPGVAPESLRDAVDAANVRRVDDPSRDRPDLTIRETPSGWQVLDSHVAGDPAVFPEVADALAGHAGRSAFLHVAPDPSLVSALRDRLEQEPSVVPAADPGEADYALACRPAIRNTRVAQTCAWLVPNRDQRDASALPLATDWIDVAAGAPERAAAALDEFAFRLARLKGWLTLSSPPAPLPFPFRLELRHAETGEPADLGRGVVLGEHYRVVLASTADDVDRAMIESGPRFVYVGGIDSDGNGHLLYPDADPDTDQCPKLPCATAPGGGYERAYTVFDDYVVHNSETDVLFLITSDERIDPQILNFRGVRSRDAGSLSRGATAGALERLLTDRAAGRTRSGTSTPLNWSIEQYPVPVAKSEGLAPATAPE